MELTEGPVLLREFTEDDAEALWAIHADPRVLRYYSPEVGAPGTARMRVDMFVRWAAEDPRDNFQLAITDRNEGTLLGSCGIRAKGCLPGQAEFGIGLDANWWGKGVALLAGTMILR